MTNADFVRNAYAAFGRGDMPGFMATCDEAIEWIYHGTVPWAGQFHGHEGVAKFFGILADTIEFEAFEPLQFIAEGDDVVVLGRTAAKVKRLGERFENNWVQVCTVRNGKLVRYVGYDTSAIAN